MKTVFTTGEAAKICKVSQQTIIRCFDNGQLKGFRVPGSKFRRIPREALYKFMRDNSIPTDALESGKPFDDIFGNPTTKFSKTNHLASTVTQVQKVEKGRWVVVKGLLNAGDPDAKPVSTSCLGPLGLPLANGTNTMR